jgi:hypothetical protein
VAALAALDTPAVEAASEGSAESGCEEPSTRLRKLETLLEAGNTRALDHLPWLERWLDTEAPWEARELPRQIETLDFPAALKTLRGLGDGVFANPR